MHVPKCGAIYIIYYHNSHIYECMCLNVAHRPKTLYLSLKIRSMCEFHVDFNLIPKIEENEIIP